MLKKDKLLQQEKSLTMSIGSMLGASTRQHVQKTRMRHLVNSMRRQFNLMHGAPDQADFPEIALPAIHGKFKLVDPR